MTNVQKLIGKTDEFVSEHTKFEKGNMSAGTRARKALMEIATLSKQIRKDIQNEKNSK